MKRWAKVRSSFEQTFAGQVGTLPGARVYGGLGALSTHVEARAVYGRAATC
jgi:hypothetical protein